MNRQDAEVAEKNFWKLEPGVELDQLAHRVIGVNYKGKNVGEARIDLLIEDRLVLELKALEGIAPIHIAQILSYLKATRLQLGLLITFNVAMLRHGIKRVVHNP